MSAACFRFRAELRTTMESIDDLPLRAVGLTRVELFVIGMIRGGVIAVARTRPSVALRSE